ncbi:ATPase [Roseivivax halodurans JCM 10272]|uniref:P-type Cu(+) transporter n=1 Tax=Roseivivax halodurans JCM 10272 TaxID=1449350 RepID=X7EF55_9RHOB|nr:heavy metal translocating P-type ATPase [Roseivivax halodurans]ETX13841.1 ATPase [Roseivivax halodurans JCM 10272]
MPAALRFEIDGMHCAGCVGRAERALEAAPGVSGAQVNLATEVGQVAVGDARAVRTALAEAGYPAREDTYRFAVSGMHCASCTSRVEDSLARLSGVVSARVNLAAEIAEVTALRGSIEASDIVDAIEASGYGARPIDGTAPREETRAAEARTLQRDLIIAAALTLPVFLIEMGGHLVPALHHWTELTLGGTWNWIQLALVTTVLCVPGRRFFTTGLRLLARGTPDMNSLVALGAGAAWGYSTLVTVAPDVLPDGARSVYFEAAAVIVTLILLGRWLEARAKGRAGDAIRALMARRPATARVRRDGDVREIAADEVVPGDVIELRPGETVPVDGVLIEGRARIDEAMLTGEPAPVLKGEGDALTGGTVNGASALVMRATAVGSDTTLSRIVRMVEEAQGSKLPVEALTERVVRVFVPAVLVIAAMTVVAWLALGPGLTEALLAGVSVLIIACPCAMGLATPVSILVGTGRAAELGVLFRKGDALQRLSDARVVAFDKTGTLTEGRPELVFRKAAGERDEDDVLRLVAAAEAGSEHPLARALDRAAGNDLPLAEDVTAIEGRGLSARVDGHDLLAGSARLMRERGIAVDELEDDLRQVQERAETPVLTSVDGQIAALFGVADRVKPSALAAIETLREAGMRIAMLTGDTRGTAEALARRLDIDDVRAELLPEDKAGVIAELQKRHGATAFVGDGINDAPALAAADVGLAIGTGTDIAIEAGDVVLVSGDVTGVATARHLSRRTMRNIRQNLVWAFGYNVLLIPVAAGALYPAFGLLLSPMIAAAAMALSSVFVVTNALRLRKVNAPSQVEATAHLKTEAHPA